MAWFSDDGEGWDKVGDDAVFPASSSGSDLVVYRDGLVAIGKVRSNANHPTPAVWHSDDGLTWQRVSASFSAQQGWVPSSPGLAKIREIGGRLFVAGSTQRANSIEGGSAQEDYSAAVWFSDDGVTWIGGSLPNALESKVNDIFEVNGTVVAVGSTFGNNLGELGRRAAVWRSDDSGANWVRLPADPEAFYYNSELESVAVAGDVLVAVGDAGEPNSGSPTSYAGVWWSR